MKEEKYLTSIRDWSRMMIEKQVYKYLKPPKPYLNTKLNLFETKPKPEKEIMMIESRKFYVKFYLLRQLVKS